MSNRFLLRRVWFQVHLWLGLALFLVLAPLSAAGSLLVWDQMLDKAANPQRYQTTGPATLPLQAYVVSARVMLGEGKPVSSIRLPEDGEEPVVVSAPIDRRPGGAPPRGRPPQINLYLDPGSGRVLDMARSDKGLVRWLHVFHGSLQMPGVGRKVVGWLGWAMLVSALTGIWLWWPRNHQILKGLRWRRAPLLSSNLHHQVGFWISIPLAVLAFSGAWISFPQTFRGFVAAVTGGPAPKASPQGGPGGGGGGGRPPAIPLMTPDQAAATARAASPGAELVSVGWPAGKKAQWNVRVQPPSGGPVTYGVDDRTGAAKLEGGGPDAAARTARLMRVIHDGTNTGVVWQTIIFVAGWAPTLLGITGLLMWLRNRGGRRARNAWRQNGADATSGG